MGIERARQRRQRLGRAALDEAHPPQAPLQREHRGGQYLVGVIGDDALGRLPHPLSPSPLGRGRVAAVVVTRALVVAITAAVAGVGEVARVGHQALDTGGDVEHPQRVDGIDRSR